ncbi:MAG: protein kinase domain-containing protein [Chakrabartia sp.]
MLTDYRLDQVLGQGGFGITYLATDLSLDQRVAIKEYFPREFAVRDSTRMVLPSGKQEDHDNFAWGLARFREEARTLARFSHPNIIAVRRLFEANGTSYIVMDFCEGEPLDAVITRDAPLAPKLLERVFLALLDGLEHVHDAGVMHRDIKPANIFIRADGSPVLLDFGAARQAFVSHSRSMTSLATAHYAAFEQYSTKGKQGAWTDIYGLSATLYHAATGEKPQDAPDRVMQDRLVPLTQRPAGRYPANMLGAIDAGLAIRPENRPQRVAQWRELLGSAAGQPARTDTSPATPAATPKSAIALPATLAGIFVLILIISYVALLPGSENSQGDAPSPRQAPPVDSGPVAEALPTPSGPGGGSTTLPPSTRNARALLANYVAVLTSNDIEAVRNLYADSVTFYGVQTPRETIVDQKAKFMARWPVRTWRIHPDSIQEDCQPDGACKLSVVADWTASNPSTNRSSQGVATIDVGFTNGLVTFEGYK